MGNTGIDAILIMPEILTQSSEGWTLISRFAHEHQLPAAGSAAFEAYAGAVFSYIPDYIKIGRPAASLVIAPESLLRLNCTLAMKLGSSVSESMMSLANEVIR